MKTKVFFSSIGLMATACGTDISPTTEDSDNKTVAEASVATEKPREHKFQWELQPYPLGHYIIEFPSKNIPATEWRVREFPFGKLKVNSASISHSYGRYIVQFWEYPKDISIDRDVLKIAHDVGRQTMLKADKTKNLGDKVIEHSGLEGWQSDFRVENDEYVDAIRYRTFGQGKRIYNVIWIGDFSDLESDFVQRFLDSFKVESPAPPVPTSPHPETKASENKGTEPH